MSKVTDTNWIANPPGDVEWWEGGEGPALVPMRGSNLPCGCYIRRPDYEAVLCSVHLAELNDVSHR